VVDCCIAIFITPCPWFGTYICKSNLIADFAFRLGILEEPLNHVSIEFTTSAIHFIHSANVMWEPTLDKLVLDVVQSLVADTCQPNKV
jgi:hypothetical protein